jgi:pyridoxine 5-phosphate synthase
MVRLSVNINKVALIRNARGEGKPDLVTFARDCESFGAQGITVHPRPDERHIRYSDLAPLKEVVKTEFNIEGNPTDTFVDHVLRVRPHQVTLVPDAPDALTSDAGWDTIGDYDRLVDVVQTFQEAGIRTSLFIDPIVARLEAAAKIGTDRIEFYTGPFAKDYESDPLAAIAAFTEASKVAHGLGLGINAGHDLNLHNLQFFVAHMPHLAEVSIGHALVIDALYYGVHNAIQMYLRQIDLAL